MPFHVRVAESILQFLVFFRDYEGLGSGNTAPINPDVPRDALEQRALMIHDACGRRFRLPLPVLRGDWGEGRWGELRSSPNDPSP